MASSPLHVPISLVPCTVLRVGLVGSLPPPSGGMANQTEQFVRWLSAEGVDVELVRTNAPYQPSWVARIPWLRAGFRLIPYMVNLWMAAGRVHVMHVKANSGWAWHLFVTPAVLIARARAVPFIISYHGGGADAFFAQAPGYVLKLLAQASVLVTPSVFLQRVFAKYGLCTEVIPNVIDLARFVPVARQSFGNSPHVVVTRNLEAIYDIPTAIRAFLVVKQAFAGATMTIAGSGAELANLRALVARLQLGESVHFSGRLDNASMAALYASADCVVNPSTVDNMPNSILEAFASGVPVVSTNAGGVSDMLEDGVSGMLVPVGDDVQLAEQVLKVLHNPSLAERLRKAGLTEAEKYSWTTVKSQWLSLYPRALARQRNL